jgi:hypothetical protein
LKYIQKRNTCESYIFDDDEDIIIEYEMNECVGDDLKYFKHMLNTKTILLNEIYDIHDNKFTKQLIKRKCNIDIEYYGEFRKCRDEDIIKLNCNSKTTERIRQLFYCNCIINNDLYSNIIIDDHDTYIDTFNTCKRISNFDYLNVDVGIDNYMILSIGKINSKFYDYKTCRMFTPYLIQWDDNNTYYMVNRDYEYIGIGSKNAPDDFKVYDQCYLYNDGVKPWRSKKGLDKLRKNFRNTVEENQLGTCMNPNEFTEEILAFSSN